MPKFTELPGASPPGPPPGLCPGPAGGLTAVFAKKTQLTPSCFFGPYGRATTKMLPTGLLKLYGERLKFYHQVKFLGITFDSKFTFKKHFEDILGRCNARYHRIRLLTNKKWGPSPSTILQIYKQCVRPIFEYGSLSTITTSDTIISEIQRLQNKFIRLALRLPKYISVKLLHDSSSLPYVKDRLFSRATKTLERISANPLVEESISSNKVNPAWDRFPTPLSVIHPVSL